jgi:hypothetical protein
MALRYLGLVLLAAAALGAGCKNRKGSEVKECYPCCTPVVIDAGGCCGVPVSSGGHHGGAGGGGGGSCGCGGGY